MRYTKRTLVISQSNISEAEQRVARQRQVVEQLEDTRHPSVDAMTFLLVMEQSLLSMRRFLATLERDLELSVGSDKPGRKKAARSRAKAGTDKLAQAVVDVLRDGGIDAEVGKIGGTRNRAQDSAPSALRSSR
jgi:hypothetical protein